MKKRKTKKNYIFPHASSSAFLHIAVLVFGTVAIVILERDLDLRERVSRDTRVNGSFVECFLLERGRRDR